MAAETLRAAGIEVDLFDAMKSVGRKFLIAGKGGLNLTHAEARPQFDARYRERAQAIGAWLDDFDAHALREWARGFGIETYIGSSGRVFPDDRKAAPLLRGWVRRLRESGVRFHMQHRWLGWADDGALRFATPEGEYQFDARATVLAMGGGSWPQLGSDGRWVTPLIEAGIDTAPLQPANCGFDIGWSTHLAGRFAGAPLKPIIAHWHDSQGREHALQGECVLTKTGIEGSLIYAISAELREAINRQGRAMLWLDLAPARDLPRLQHALGKPRGKRSIGEHIRRQTGLDAAKTALLFEVLGKTAGEDPAALAAAIKRLPLALQRPRPIDEAISSAGGIRLEALDERLMLRDKPGGFAAGEMLDWEAPTGGYLLQASFASGLRAGRGAASWLGAAHAAERG